ncbi:hypothetical protein A0128_15200 [Leptospira tipperaryensis]|uniref:Uncharacterized protein n=1 Tax=Leptospira tipperaryensis TaxID=2564040 RepID=A0A1D7UZR5_9LEPT|nr:hypothetical protein A0128_15200 [Leptospira tipperaryensis]
MKSSQNSRNEKKTFHYFITNVMIDLLRGKITQIKASCRFDLGRIEGIRRKILENHDIKK